MVRMLQKIDTGVSWRPAVPIMTEQELWFYRKLFLKRYAALLKRTQELYKLTPEQMTALQTTLLDVEWVDRAIQKLPSAYQ